MLLIILACLVLLLIGLLEKRKHDQEIDKIPLRINVNGIRGKSTVTRLITGILTEANYKTVGKTTGTEARMIYWDRSEKPIVRKPEGANIKEQKFMLQKASSKGAEAFVSECMAINPEYQRILQQDFLKANVGVILNVYEDHMDIMGPSLDHVADGFTSTIPYNGKLIVGKGPYYELFTKIAKERNTEVFTADEDEIPEGFLQRFSYMVFPENITIPLAVAKAVGIDKETALRGMLRANPDPGALRILSLAQAGKEPSFMINGFAANDAHSTLSIWDRLKDSAFMKDDTMIIMNCREDRVDRTKDFCENVLPYLPANKLVLIGRNVYPALKAMEKGLLPYNRVINLEAEDREMILETVKREANGSTIYGVGNIHGMGELFMEELRKSPDVIERNVGEEAI